MDTQLVAASESLAQVLLAAPDETLNRTWVWGEYDGEGVRFASLVAYGYLRELAALLGTERTPATIAQRILAQFHAAYRDLQVLLLDIDNDFAEKPPAEGEWSIREIVSHIVEADAIFYATVVANLGLHRAGAWNGEPISNDAYEQLLGPEAETLAILAGPLSGLMSYHATIHARVLQELANITDAETLLPVRFWETQIYQLRFRLQRFDAHNRQHTIQIEKTLNALGKPPTEGSRLARILYAALAEAESQLIGAPDTGVAACAEVVEAITDLAAQAREVLVT